MVLELENHVLISLIPREGKDKVPLLTQRLTSTRLYVTSVLGDGACLILGNAYISR